MKKALTIIAFVALLFSSFAIAEQSNDSRSTIQGSDVKSYLAMFEEFGIATPQPIKTESGERYTAENVSINGALCSYLIESNEAGEISAAYFVMENKDNGFFDVAAKMPYESAIPSYASSFVKSSIGDDATTTIGDAVFSVFDASYFNGSRITVGNKVVAQDGYEVKLYRMMIVYTDEPVTMSCANVIRDVRVRASSSTNAKLLGTLKSGETAVLVTPFYNDEWHEILYNGEIGYIWAAYTEIDN